MISITYDANGNIFAVVSCLFSRFITSKTVGYCHLVSIQDSSISTYEIHVICSILPNILNESKS